jgi:hypothetical protein
MYNDQQAKWDADSQFADSGREDIRDLGYCVNPRRFGLRARTMSFDAVILQHAQGLLGLQDESVKIARDGLLADLMSTTTPLLAGSALTDVNLSVLSHAAKTVSEILSSDNIGDGFAIPDLYSWMQTVGTVATTEALYGSENPIAAKQGLLYDVW